MTYKKAKFGKFAMPYQPTQFYGLYSYADATYQTCKCNPLQVQSWYEATSNATTQANWNVQAFAQPQSAQTVYASWWDTGNSLNQPYSLNQASSHQALDQATIDHIARDAEERRVKHAVAASRAEELLFTFIGEERKKQYAEFGHFDVPVNGNIYRIRKGRSMNVIVLENGAPKLKLCAHPADAVPDGDTMLAQFLMLTSNEKRFLEIANKSAWDEAWETGRLGHGYTPAANMANFIAPPAPNVTADELAYMEARAFAQVELAA